MNDAFQQDLTAWGLVAVAAGYLLRRAWQIVRRPRSSGCGTCASCPQAGCSSEPQVFPVELLRQSPARR